MIPRYTLYSPTPTTTLHYPSSPQIRWSFEGYGEGSTLNDAILAAALNVPNAGIRLETAGFFGAQPYNYGGGWYFNPYVARYRYSTAYRLHHISQMIPPGLRPEFEGGFPPFPDELRDLPLISYWWEFEGYGPYEWPIPVASRVQVAVDYLGIFGGYFVSTQSAIARMRILDGSTLTVTEDDLIAPAQPPLPTGGRFDWEYPVPTGIEGVTLSGEPIADLPVDERGLLGVMLTTDHVDDRAIAMNYAQVTSILDFITTVPWPPFRWGYTLGIPPLRQRQRGDGLVIGDQRQYVRGNPKSLQSSVRQLWSGSFL